MEEVPGQPVAPKNLEEQAENKDSLVFTDEHGIVRYKATGQIAPGNSGNPGGRPKGSYSIMTIIRKKMEEIPLGQTKEWREQLAEVILEEAVVHRKGDMIKLIANYMDGMPNQKIDVGVDTDDMGSLTDFFRGLAATGNASKKKAVKKEDDNGKDGTGTE